MTSLITKYVGRRIFKENKINAFGCEDPYFETVPAKQMSGRDDPSKTKKRKKALPPGLTPTEEKVLIKVKRRAYRLDMSLFNMCGLQFGISSLIAFIPVIGDFADALLALMVVKTAMQASIPESLVAKMMMNVIVDFFVGLIPLVGDLVDVAFKANTRNAALLEQHLRERGKENLKKQGITGVHDPSLVDVRMDNGGEGRSRERDLERGEGGYSEEIRGERSGDRRERSERNERREDRRERRERREERVAEPQRPPKAAKKKSHGTTSRHPGGYS